MSCYRQERVIDAYEETQSMQYRRADWFSRKILTFSCLLFISLFHAAVGTDLNFFLNSLLAI
jgi:hypothetical protein